MAQEPDALLARVEDPALRDDLRRSIDQVRVKRTFGLVFERHPAERVTLLSHPVRRGVIATLTGLVPVRALTCGCGFS